MVSLRKATDTGSRPELTIVLPAHNEAQRIEPTLRAYAQFFGTRAEILVVLNACTDATLQVVQRVQAEYSQVHYIDIQEAVGKGGAVRAGFLAAQGALVGFVDADGATAPDELNRLALMVRDEVDGVIASRWMPGADVRNRTSFLRKVASIGFRLVARSLFQLPYYDTQCGAKVFRRAVIERIADQLENRDMTFDVELLLRARAANFRIVEVPTIWTDQSSPVLVGTPLKLLTTSLTMFRSLIRLRFRAGRQHLIT